jgi:hypothetical protein
MGSDQGLRDRPIFSLGRFSLRTNMVFFYVPRRAHHHAPLAELLVEIYSLRPLVKFHKANDMSQISNFAPEF